MPSAAPQQTEVAGPPRTELEELQIRANQVTDDVNPISVFFCFQLIRFFEKYKMIFYLLNFNASLVLGQYTTNAGIMRGGN